jgi:hypothetical protein
VASPAVVGVQPWFPIDTGTLKTPRLEWRTHLHSEIAGLGSNSVSSPLVAKLGTRRAADLTAQIDDRGTAAVLSVTAEGGQNASRPWHLPR